MKTKKVTLFGTVLLLSMAMAVTSCKKKDNTPEDTDTSEASDNTLAEKTSDDVVNMAGQASEDGSLSSYKSGSNEEDAFGLSCATVTRDTVNKKITIIFNGTTCMDGHTRSGSLLIDYSGSTNGAEYYRNPGFQCVVSSANYVVDNNNITISKTISNTTAPGFDPSKINLTWSISANVAITKPSNGGTVNWKANKVKTLLNTSDTNVYRGQAIHIVWNKARVGITGNATGITAIGNNFTANVTSELVRDMTCAPNAAHPGHHPFIGGTLEFTPGTKATRYIDYGAPNSGACDDLAVVTINGKSHTITLP